MSIKVVEYLGLPASGKSWHLGEEGFCKIKNAIPHSVPFGGGSIKRNNTIKGIFYNFKLFLLILRIAIYVFFNERSKFVIRPFFVVFERYGRILSLRRRYNKEVHIDEGVLQFIWRIFSELSKSSKTLFLLEKCFSLLNPEEHSITYISCPKKKHISQVIKRNKINSNFDAAIINGDNKLYNYGRFWMAKVLKYARKYDFEIALVQNNKKASTFLNDQSI